MTHTARLIGCGSFPSECPARKAPWEEPGAPEASAERIETFFRVRATSQAAAEGARKSWEVFDTEQDLGFWGQAQEGLKAYEIWAATRQAFGRALVDEGMSADEYRYLHRLLFHSGLVEGSISGDPIPLEGLEEVPEEARVVVTGFAEKIQAAPSGSADGFLMGLGSEAFQVPDKGTPGSK